MTGKDEIRIDNLEVYAHHGVYPEETKEGQTFYVNAVIYTNTRKAGLKDELELSTNYGEVCHFIYNYMQENTYKLIETVAERMSEDVLLSFPLIHELELEIRKPQAPIGLPLESVSVKIKRGWHTAYISLGSNMGKRENYISGAIEAMKGEKKIRVRKTSEILHTKPYGGAATEEFLNAAVKIETLFTPRELLRKLQYFEQEAGRERKVRWGNRTLDLDIIFYDDLVMTTEDLIIPHPDMLNRDFVLVPLAQIDPYIMHPVHQKTVRMLLDKLIKTNGRFII